MSAEALTSASSRTDGAAPPSRSHGTRSASALEAADARHRGRRARAPADADGPRSAGSCLDGALIGSAPPAEPAPRGPAAASGRRTSPTAAAGGAGAVPWRLAGGCLAVRDCAGRARDRRRRLRMEGRRPGPGSEAPAGGSGEASRASSRAGSARVGPPAGRARAPRRAAGCRPAAPAPTTPPCARRPVHPLDTLRRRGDRGFSRDRSTTAGSFVRSPMRGVAVEPPCRSGASRGARVLAAHTVLYVSDLYGCCHLRPRMRSRGGSSAGRYGEGSHIHGASRWSGRPPPTVGGSLVSRRALVPRRQATHRQAATRTDCVSVRVCLRGDLMSGGR